MKKRILSHLLICIITCILVVPFSIVKGATTITQYSTGTFDQGVWTTYYAENNNSYVIIEEFDIQNTMQFVQATITKFDLNDYYDGDIDITCYGNISTNLWEFYVQGEGAYITGSTSTHIYIHVVNCQQFYLIGLCGNDLDINLRPKTIATGLTKANGSSVVINPNYIQKFRFWINADDQNNPPWPNITYTTTQLNNFSYFNNSLNNYSVRRLDAHFNYEITNGNFFVCTFYLKSSTSIEKWGTGMVGIRDFTGVNRDYSSQVYRYFYKTPLASGSYVYLCTIYIPIGILSKSNNGYDYNIQLNSGVGYLTNTTAVGWIYRGVVDSIPDYVLNQSTADSTASDLTQANNDLNSVSQDIEDFESNITTDFYNNMNNIDLDDYNIFTQLSDTSYYFKTYINDFFNHIGDFKALFIVPIIVTVLMLIVGWVM